NALSVLHFSGVFDHKNLYQLVPGSGKDEAQFTPKHLRGRFLFGKGVTFKFITARVEAGATIKSTPLTEEFRYQDFKATYGEEVVPLFVITRNNRLIPFTVEDRLEPEPGTTIIALVFDRDEQRRDRSDS